ncbi:MAG: nickel pincer cofactor biosynthesis protein LarC, partial [Phycisphaerae bacterium]
THRHLPQISRIIQQADLPDPVKTRAEAIFNRLAQAEARVHGCSIEQVHFHEVGAADAIIDIVGAALAIELLQIERVRCSPIPTGSGVVHCEHGVLPVPAPATAVLLEGAPLAECDEPGELTTPTGAAVLTTLADSYGPPPAMVLRGVGLGAGSRDGLTRPNVLRFMFGDATAEPDHAESDRIVVLETNLDDCTGEQIGHAAERLLAGGALDVFTTAIQMKKGRPGVRLTVLAEPHHADELEERLFAETTTFGVRRYEASRRKLRRASTIVQTPFGPIPVKIGSRGRKILVASPEYEPCAAAARTHGVPLQAVLDAARQAWRDAPPGDSA